MIRGKDTDNSSSTDTESLGETTDVLNMVIVFLFMYLDISLILVHHVFVSVYVYTSVLLYA